MEVYIVAVCADHLSSSLVKWMALNAMVKLLQDANTAVNGTIGTSKRLDLRFKDQLVFRKQINCVYSFDII